MYDIIMYAIQFGIAVGSRFNEKLRRMWRGEREAVRTLQEKVDPDARYIWFHAASLGEFEQGRPLMEQIRRDCPQYRILLTGAFPPTACRVSSVPTRSFSDGTDGATDVC